MSTPEGVLQSFFATRVAIQTTRVLTHALERHQCSVRRPTIRWFSLPLHSLSPVRNAPTGAGHHARRTVFGGSRVSRSNFFCSPLESPSRPTQCEVKENLHTSHVPDPATGEKAAVVVCQHHAKADVYALSRLKNYMQRMDLSPCSGVDGTFGGRSHGHDTLKRSLDGIESPPRRLSADEAMLFGPCFEAKRAEDAWICTFDLPVDVLVQGCLARRSIPVTGLAMESKMSTVAACMHAEWCLDALQIPLFTSDRRQHQRVLQAKAEGRSAPEASASPVELHATVLPPPVFLPAATSAATVLATAKLPSFQGLQTSARSSEEGGSETDASSPSASGTSLMTCVGSCPPSSRTRRRDGSSWKGRPQRPLRRWERVAPRYSTDSFHRVALEELAALQISQLAHNRLSGEGDEDGDDEDPLAMSEDDVHVLQPELLSVEESHSSFTADGERRRRSASSPGLVLKYQPVPAASTSAMLTQMVDESEGGVYDLCEGFLEWWTEKNVPGSACLRDPHAAHRIDQYLLRTTGHAFDASTQIRITEEDTNEYVTARARCLVKRKTWYTVVLEIPRIPVPCIGKATSRSCARDLCAMHAELLLQWFGIHVFETVHEQIAYHDACLRWGRKIAAEPLDPATVELAQVRLPKPLKEWYRNHNKNRTRRAPRSLPEKVLHLNRIIVHLSRQHLMEVDAFEDERYRELLSLSEQCIRSFFVAMRHPYEGAYHCFIYNVDNQYRTTLYLPLPERYGIRGGYCIACSPQKSISGCALHAVDVLCALDVVPSICLTQPRWQRMMELRKSLHLLLPQTYCYQQRCREAANERASIAVGPLPTPLDPMLRSPPGYREAPDSPCATIPSPSDVWRIMLIDAETFDVAPESSKLIHEGLRLNEGVVPCFYRVLFEELASFAFTKYPTHSQLRQRFHQYVGAQNVSGHIRRIANTYWLELPIDEAVYGRRVAIGRCVTRRGAERMLYLHALRIAHALGLAPWDTLSILQQAAKMYDGDLQRAKLRSAQWRWFCKVMIACEDLDGRTQGVAPNDAFRGAEGKREIPEAVVTREFGHPSTRIMHAATPHREACGSGISSPPDKRAVLSPHPVMSRDLAITTLL